VCFVKTALTRFVANTGVAYVLMAPIVTVVKQSCSDVMRWPRSRWESRFRQNGITQTIKRENIPYKCKIVRETIPHEEYPHCARELSGSPVW